MSVVRKKRKGAAWKKSKITKHKHQEAKVQAIHNIGISKITEDVSNENNSINQKTHDKSQEVSLYLLFLKINLDTGSEN